MTKFFQAFPLLCTDAIYSTWINCTSNLFSQPGLTDHLKEYLACQALDPSYAIDKMCNVMCNVLVADQVRSCDPTMTVEDQLDVMMESC